MNITATHHSQILFLMWSKRQTPLNPFFKTDQYEEMTCVSLGQWSQNGIAYKLNAQWESSWCAGIFITSLSLKLSAPYLQQVHIWNVIASRVNCSEAGCRPSVTCLGCFCAYTISSFSCLANRNESFKLHKLLHIISVYRSFSYTWDQLRPVACFIKSNLVECFIAILVIARQK